MSEFHQILGMLAGLVFCLSMVYFFDDDIAKSMRGCLKSALKIFKFW